MMIEGMQHEYCLLSYDEICLPDFSRMLERKNDYVIIFELLIIHRLMIDFSLSGHEWKKRGLIFELKR
jgi:hypothetical protein